MTVSTFTFTCARTPEKQLAYTNKVYSSSKDFTEPIQLQIGNYVFLAEPHNGVTSGTLGLSVIHRDLTKRSINAPFIATRFNVPEHNFTLDSLTIAGEFIGGGISTQSQEVDAAEFIKYLKREYNGQVFRRGQYIATEFAGKKVKVSIEGMDVVIGDFKDDASSDEFRESVSLGMLTDSTDIVIANKQASKGELEIVWANLPAKSGGGNTLFNQKFSFNDLGIGGLDAEMNRIFTHAFTTRLYSPDVIKLFNTKHVKGIMLYGPPGTGKTLIARQIGKVLNTKEPKLVNGPEVLDKMVGGSEANVRILFADAIADMQKFGDKSPLHLIIFDEIDAICKQRGSTRDGTGVHDSVVNQLLTMIDGVKSLNNILVIGMTNRIDLLDKALLRPGRFEVQIEIGLPDKTGREQILDIHTRIMKENGLLADDVDLNDVAERTKNYSGAELMGVVKCAVAYALNRPIKDIKDIQSQDFNIDGLQVTKEDFDLALLQVKAAFGVASNDFKSSLNNGIISHSQAFNEFLKTGESWFKQIQKSTRTNLLSILLQGSNGSGKTSVASHLAVKSAFPYAKIISSDALIGYSESSVVDYITQTFLDAYKSPCSVIVLDDIEDIIQYVPLGQRFSHTITSTIIAALKKRPPTNRKLLVIGTTSNAETLSRLAMTKSFNVTLKIPALDRQSIRNILVQSATFESDQELDEIVSSCPEDITIKQLLLVAETASSEIPSDESQAIHITAENFNNALLESGVYNSN
jgi:vesicle-fusing ATPase